MGHRADPAPRAGTQLVRRAIQGMALQGATEVALEAETHNAGALAMYEGLGFIRDKRLERCPTCTPTSAVLRHDQPCSPVEVVNVEAVLHALQAVCCSQPVLAPVGVACNGGHAAWRRYYLSGTDAFRLKLLLPEPPEGAEKLAARAEAAAEARRLEAMEANAASLQRLALQVESVA